MNLKQMKIQLNLKRIIFALFTLLLTHNAYCEDKPRKTHYSLLASSTLNKGNIKDLNAKAALGIDNKDSVVGFNINAKYTYSEKNEKGLNKDYYGIGKLDFFQYNRWSPFIGIEGRRNTFKGYDYKAGALIGGKRRLYTKKDTCDYSISMAFVFDRQKYSKKTELSNRDYRLSFRPKIKQKLGPAVTLRHMTFYKPSVENFEDYHINCLTDLEFKITKILFFDIMFDYEYHSKVPTEQYTHDDMTLDFALKFNI